ncbi:response regulator [Bradyrhizobium sp. SRL28]|uniref:response regulator n=1 Tax=Bradyrhizobium sp. SRL28 TaxID=2836178 RepID=UPI0024BF5BF5|nr:response regulator [Bradyrhizobium sp. SRL28]
MTEPIVPPPLVLPEDCNEAARGNTALNDAVKILVVEDDQLIQAMVEEALSDGGFASALTASGEEAITLLQDDKSKSKYRAVVTDINLLGKLDGWEVGRFAREIDPTMPIIYMTGTHGEEWASKGVPNSLLLAKPFAPAQIVTAISQLLNATPPVPPAD